MKRELGGCLICVAMYAAGAWSVSEARLGATERATIAADNHTLREANKVLRAQCPALPRLQRGPFEPGSTA